MPTPVLPDGSIDTDRLGQAVGMTSSVAGIQQLEVKEKILKR